jgi:hypothetical protein
MRAAISRFPQPAPPCNNKHNACPFLKDQSVQQLTRKKFRKYGMESEAWINDEISST